MKKKATIISLALAFVLAFGTFQAAFAAAPPTDKTREAIAENGVQCIQKIKNEVDAERIAKHLNDEVTSGKYKLIDTAALTKENNGSRNIIIIDTMPQNWWDQRHIPNSICSEAGVKGPEFIMTAQQKSDLLSKVKKESGTKKVTKYWNSKKKKWVDKKPKKKYWKKCSKKKDKFYGKKKKTVTVDVKDKKIVVYCGYVGCARSHEAAKFLVQNGYTNVYRYAGGISAWVDANNNIDGSDVAQ